MIVATKHSPEGYPQVSWTEKLAHGSTKVSALFWVIIICGLLGFVIGSSSGIVPALAFGVVGLFVGFISGTKGLSEGKDRPLFRNSECYARSYMLSDGSIGLEYRRDGVTHNVFLKDITAFEFGDYENWFGDAASAGSYHKYFVIIASTPDGIQRVATHSGSKADIAHLHAVLTDEFVTKRKNFMPKLASGRPAAIRPVAGTPAAATPPAAVGAQQSWGSTTWGASASPSRPTSNKPKSL